MPKPTLCLHADLETDVSSHAFEVGFQLPNASQRAAAATAHGQAERAAADGIQAADPWTFPAPLVLPDDLFSIDPDKEGQSFYSWNRRDRHRKGGEHRRVLYFAAAPGCAPSATFAKSWAEVQDADPASELASAPSSMFDGVYEYLQAFYHGMEVKKFDGDLCFVDTTSPETSSETKSNPKAKKTSKSKSSPNPSGKQIGLEFTRRSDRYVLDIRSRVSPHEENPTYPRQLNLNDLLDCAIAMLPADAYALLLLVDHDLYEDDEDDFCCGRAYGGSRVAVVSASRYNPVLDPAVPGTDRNHAWPASHCKAFIQSVLSGGEEPAPKKPRKTGASRADLSARAEAAASPLGAAVKAFLSSSQSASARPRDLNLPLDLASQSRLWLSRVCKTASHELGHCLGIGHCDYYACIMQGTAGLAEDARQPPYLCPVDRRKVLAVTGASAAARDRALLGLCRRRGWREEPMFRAYAAWLEKGLEKMEEDGEGELREERTEDGRVLVVLD